MQEQVPHTQLERWEKMDESALRAELRSVYRLWHEARDEVSRYRQWFAGLRELLNVDERPGPDD